jgi:hypothetical protein
MALNCPEIEVISNQFLSSGGSTGLRFYLVQNNKIAHNFAMTEGKEKIRTYEES